MKLTATRGFTYATRRLQPGDDFEAPSMVARALIGVKKAKAADQPEPPLPEPQPPPDEREKLREEAESLGIDVDGRWSADHLRREIEAAVARSVPRYEEPEPEPEAKPE